MRLHVARLFTALLLLWSARHHPVLAVAAGVFLFLAAFAFNHDVLHGALGLPRRANEALLTVLSLLMGWSGHAVRRLHLKHHARPLAGGDVEGHGATLSFWGALAAGPLDAARYRVAALEKERTAQLLENAAVVALTAAALASRTVLGAAWVVTSVAMQLTASVWASWLPHRPPGWLKAIALRLSWTKSAAMLSFAFHAEHHAHPKVPCGELSAAGRR